MSFWVDMLPSFVIALIGTVLIIASAVYLTRWLERPTRRRRDASAQSDVQALEPLTDHPDPQRNPETPAPRAG